jgi:hypothetical protein
MFSPRSLLLVFAISILYSVSKAGSINEQPSVRLMNIACGEVLMLVVGLGTGWIASKENQLERVVVLEHGKHYKSYLINDV